MLGANNDEVRLPICRISDGQFNDLIWLHSPLLEIPIFCWLLSITYMTIIFLQSIVALHHHVY